MFEPKRSYSIMKGNTGKILHVDLTASSFAVETPDEMFYRTYVGGACMGAYYVTRLVPVGADPLGPENVLVFTTSAITAASISGNARHCASAKSPLTGGIMNSEGGGYWGPELKAAGFDAVVLHGKASRPVYLWIHDGQCGLRDASLLWGRETGEVEDAIRKELGDEGVRVLQIGPAGERGVRFAAIVNELRHFNGRGGLGAVMGSKNLRAVAVRGSAQPELADRAKVVALARAGARKVQESPSHKAFKDLGTIQSVTDNTAIGGLPTRNWTMGTFDQYEKLSAEAYASTMMDRPGTCWACAQNCKRDVKAGIEKPWRVDPRYGGPEYETVGMLGSNCMVADLSAVVKANEIANRYCVDTISLGGVIGLVMECFESGLLTEEQIGFRAPFGDGEALVKLAEMTVERRGLGDLMAEGVARLAAALGPAAQRIAVHVKGKEFPAHTPTSKGLMALLYAVGSFGPDHMSAAHDEAFSDGPNESHRGIGIYQKPPGPNWEINLEKVKILAASQRLVSAIDSWAVCQFCYHTWTIFNIEDLVALVQAVTGWRYTTYELMQLGERRINLLRAFNAREGFTKRDDDLPRRLFEDPLLDDGPTGGRTVNREDFLRCREEYYHMMCWDPETGNPTPTKLRELGLEWTLEPGPWLGAARGVGVSTADAPPVGEPQMVTVGDKRIPWREGLTVMDVVRELGLPESYPLADIGGRFVWKRDWEITAVPGGVNVRFHWIIGGG
jgi:aldehyde:ferredoxin oxidoreductase